MENNNNVTILQKMPCVGKWQCLFLIHLFFLFVQIQGRINFMQMGCYGKYNESSYRRNFSKSFDFQLFNVNSVFNYLIFSVLDCF